MVRTKWHFLHSFMAIVKFILFYFIFYYIVFLLVGLCVCFKPRFFPICTQIVIKTWGSVSVLSQPFSDILSDNECRSHVSVLVFLKQMFVSFLPFFVSICNIYLHSVHTQYVQRTAFKNLNNVFLLDQLYAFSSVPCGAFQFVNNTKQKRRKTHFIQYIYWLSPLTFRIK